MGWVHEQSLEHAKRCYEVADPKFRPDTYLQRDGELYRVVGKALDDDLRVTGKYELENASTGWTKPVDSSLIMREFDIVRAAAAAGAVPSYLDWQMHDHLKSVGLAPYSRTPQKPAPRRGTV
jgi:hypothetical protein